MNSTKMQQYNYLSRKIDSEYLSWRANSDRLPILLNGARQVGKTESVRHFARQAGLGRICQL